jgi:hypothetical protein
MPIAAQNTVQHEHEAAHTYAREYMEQNSLPQPVCLPSLALYL